MKTLRLAQTLPPDLPCLLPVLAATHPGFPYSSKLGGLNPEGLDPDSKPAKREASISPDIGLQD